MNDLKYFCYVLALLVVVILVSTGIYAAWPTFVAVANCIVFVFALVVVIALPTALVFGVWFAVSEIQARKLKYQRFAPSEQGYYEALLITDVSGQQAFIKPADNVPLLVPHTYSPRIELHNSNELAQLPGAEQVAIYQQPPLETIIEELTPNALEFIYGLEPTTGELIKTSLPKAVHIQLLGASGMGKSREATGILTQLCSRNDPQHLQLALIDCENETTAPFHRLPHVRYLADDPREAARTLHNLVGELERRDKVKIIYPALLIFVEEFLNLRRTMPEAYRDQALEDYTTLALRGRKRGLFLFSIGQTAYTEKAIRDAQAQFLSSMAFAIKPTAARSAGFTNTELLNKLYSERRPGQFLLERPAGDSILLAPYVDTNTVPAILHQSESQRDTDPLIVPIETQSKANREPTRNPIDPALEAELAQVLTLLQQGVANKADIILSIWGKRSGKSEVYKQAEEEYTRIMQHISTLVSERGVSSL